MSTARPPTPASEGSMACARLGASGWIHSTRAMDHFGKGEFEQVLAEAALAQQGGAGSVILP